MIPQRDVKQYKAKSLQAAIRTNPFVSLQRIEPEKKKKKKKKKATQKTRKKHEPFPMVYRKR